MVAVSRSRRGGRCGRDCGVCHLDGKVEWRERSLRPVSSDFHIGTGTLIEASRDGINQHVQYDRWTSFSEDMPPEDYEDWWCECGRDSCYACGDWQMPPLATMRDVLGQS